MKKKKEEEEEEEKGKERTKRLPCKARQGLFWGKGRAFHQIFSFFTDRFPDFSLFSLVFPVHVAFLLGGGPGAGVKGKGKNQNPLHLMCCDWKGGALVCCHVVVVVIRYSTCTVAKVHNCLVPEENGPLGARVTTYLR